MKAKPPMRKRSRPIGRFQPGVDSLDERCLPSSFPGPFSPAPPLVTMVEMVPRAAGSDAGGRVPGPSASSPAIAGENTGPGQGPAPPIHPAPTVGVGPDAHRVLDPSAGGAVIASVLNPTGPAHPPSGGSGLTVSPDLANIRPVAETVHVAAESDTPAILAPVNVPASIVATLTIPGVSNGPAGFPATFEVQTGGGPLGVGPLHPPIGLPSGPSGEPPAGSIPARPQVGEAGGLPPGEGGLRIAPSRESPREAPPPRRAGLIIESLPFDRASLEESVSRFLDHLKDRGMPVKARADHLPYCYLLVTAAVAFEVTRRWRNHHLASGTSDLGKRRGPAFPGLS
jgi:hypothetical protein